MLLVHLMIIEQSVWMRKLMLKDIAMCELFFFLFLKLKNLVLKIFSSIFSYETVGGILAEEVGTFENIGLKQEGVRTQGYVQITDTNGISYRIDYQTDSKDAYIPRGEAPRIPPSIVKLLSLLESRK